MTDLAGRRVVVAGASAGIGRATALAAVRAGASVVLVARRGDALDAAVAEAGGGTAVVADVCDPGGPAAIAAATRDALGEIDLVVHAVGVADLRRLVDTTPETWHATFSANVVAFNEVVRAVGPLMAPGGIVAVLSSETTVAPRSGLGAYAASKAALEASVRAWRVEQSAVRFSCVVVGATQPSEFGVAFEAEELDRAITSWVNHGLMQDELMHTDHVASVLVDTFAGALRWPGVGVETLVLRSPSPVSGPTWQPPEVTLEGPAG